ncbi:isopentenyl-diphosphate Delta-isomerase [Gordonia sp. HNM0687]|uniref:Isopentenyl-diphosphate Delta-isomerase n=1 Tax=Gordonia mangrovi TaxID=2665643 RepID=A0A6L7GSU1_9ACTN|nr:isopentenyl-diphosphate Delta-isomerase [Gordonia mangrovi]MXP21725.1 isopentenyl-diphosphate Delta-isomerase [Gordonia mangrovi]UVF80457.1 isopentenyl-diphosphate Delta-isomerase [Gordonia mangrovi]
MTTDLVVLVDAERRPRGTAPRGSVHGSDTPLHLAFSCHVVDDFDRILMTRRALTKRTWPGVWTNSFCGHPRPEEPIEDAVRRYAPRELGFEVSDLACVLPDFSYRAVDASGMVENEVCPVYRARPCGSPVPNPDEVMDFVWAPIEDVWTSALRTPWVFSPWFVDQVHALGADPYRGIAG